LDELQNEYESLRKLLREEASVDVPTFLEGGDPNPDFVVYQDTLEETNSRLLELENILKNYIIIKKPPKEAQDKVDLGAKVILKNGDSTKTEFKIVGTLEANPFEGKISNESPAGAAFIGKRVGDIINLRPDVNYKILKIQYGDA